MLVHFVGGFAAAVRGALGVVAKVHLVDLFDGLVQVVLQGGHGGADGGGSETVGDEAEVGEAALDARLQDGRGAGVSQRRAVLSEQVGEFFADLFGSEEHVLARVDFVAIHVRPAQVLGYCFGRKLCLAHITKVSG